MIWFYMWFDKWKGVKGKIKCLCSVVDDCMWFDKWKGVKGKTSRLVFRIACGLISGKE
jgi:hypothetical protein